MSVDCILDGDDGSSDRGTDDECHDEDVSGFVDAEWVSQNGYEGEILYFCESSVWSSKPFKLRDIQCGCHPFQLAGDERCASCHYMRYN